MERVVGGKYKLERILGRGGMGDVYAASTPNGERAAVKLLRSEHASTDALIERFKREAKIASRVQSPFVAKMMGAGHARDGDLWIAFELLEGETLRERIRRAGPLSVRDAGPIVDDILQGLIAVHAAGVVHRDIKPSNIFLATNPAGEVIAKLLDFGVSKVDGARSGSSNPALTGEDDTLGTESFMAPEQLGRSAGVDVRADLYALGVTLFYALTGTLPFLGATAAARLQHRQTEDPRTLTAATGQEWLPELEHFIRRLAARQPEERFASAAEARDHWFIVAALTSATSSTSVVSAPGAPDDDTETDLDQHTESSDDV